MNFVTYMYTFLSAHFRQKKQTKKNKQTKETAHQVGGQKELSCSQQNIETQTAVRNIVNFCEFFM